MSFNLSKNIKEITKQAQFFYTHKKFKSPNFSPFLGYHYGEYPFIEIKLHIPRNCNQSSCSQRFPFHTPPTQNIELETAALLSSLQLKSINCLLKVPLPSPLTNVTLCSTVFLDDALNTTFRNTPKYLSFCVYLQAILVVVIFGQLLLGLCLTTLLYSTPLLPMKHLFLPAHDFSSPPLHFALHCRPPRNTTFDKFSRNLE